MSLNKNVSVWRGDSTPPTGYHLWIKDDNQIYLYDGDTWVSIILETADETEEKVVDYIDNKTSIVDYSDIKDSGETTDLSIFIKFETKDDYDEAVSNNIVSDGLICFVVETNQIYTSGIAYDGEELEWGTF